jgi:hypothetical protein
MTTAIFWLNKDIHDQNKKIFRYLFQLDGQPITDLRQISADCKMLVVSQNRHFIGLKAFDRISDRKKIK